MDFAPWLLAAEASLDCLLLETLGAFAVFEVFDALEVRDVLDALDFPDLLETVEVLDFLGLEVFEAPKELEAPALSSAFKA